MVIKFGGLTAVDGVSIYLNKNEILGLIGSNGAGKTTLFNMISGALIPTAGVIHFKGKMIRRPVAHLMCSMGIGRTFQMCKPFSSLTVLENTMVGAFLRNKSIAIARDKSEKILKIVGLEHKSETKGLELNLAELKRMELARALATEPDVLLLDEVMGGLNPVESQNFIELIRQIRATGISIIVIEHVMRAIMNLSDRIYVLDQGKLIAEGTPKEITENPIVIKSYLGENKHVTR